MSYSIVFPFQVMRFPIAKGAERVEDPLEDVTEFSIKYLNFKILRFQITS